jgi:hypothetical protein
VIRFRTVEPVTSEKPVAKSATPALAPVVVEEIAAEEAPAGKGKGLTRKTPLRAKTPAAARLFRD